MKLAVLGSPIAHSRSPQLQTCFAESCGVGDFSYIRIETTCETLRETVDRLVNEGYDGFNCTMPLKTDMAALGDTLTHEAKILRSVNTVAIRDGKFDCDTTDGGGIILTAKRAFSELAGRRVLLLGAGGAARSAALSLKLAGCELTVLNRTAESARALCEMIGGGEFDTLTVENLEKYAANTELLVNCTSLGMSSMSQFESLEFVDRLPDRAAIIDAVYNPLETALLKSAKNRGLTALSGLWMLVYQGALAFRHWTGILPDEAACQLAFDTIK